VAGWGILFFGEYGRRLDCGEPFLRDGGFCDLSVGPQELRDSVND
jgi:hypothetical protein